MNNKKLTILIAVLVIIAATILFAVLINPKKAAAPISNGSQSNSENNKVNAPIETTATNSDATKVVVPEGVDASTIVPVVPVALSALPGSAKAPKQEVVEVNNIPANAVKLSVSDKGFSPKEFTVSAGQKVSLAVTAVGENTHVFIFPNASLMALTMMVANGETKVIDFTAPPAGTYSFRDDIPNYRDNTGTMIVK